MEYKEILDSARTCIGPYCKACPVCNGKGGGNATLARAIFAKDEYVTTFIDLIEKHLR